MKEAAISAHHPSNPPVFVLKATIRLLYRDFCYVSPHCLTQNTKEMCTQRSRFSKTNTALFYFYCGYMAMKNTMNLVHWTPQCTRIQEYNESSTLEKVLIHVRTLAVLPTVAFEPSEKITNVKKANNVLVSL